MRRNQTIERALQMAWWQPPYFIPKTIIPPSSVVRVHTIPHGSDYFKIGDTFRIGYYNPKDGPNVVRLVNGAGMYEYYLDQADIVEYFDIVSLSDEIDNYGYHRPILEPLS